MKDCPSRDTVYRYSKLCRKRIRSLIGHYWKMVRRICHIFWSISEKFRITVPRKRRFSWHNFSLFICSDLYICQITLYICTTYLRFVFLHEKKIVIVIVVVCIERKNNNIFYCPPRRNGVDARREHTTYFGYYFFPCITIFCQVMNSCRQQ